MTKGSCHCGRVRWTVHSPIESVTACNCTLCRRYGALWAYGMSPTDIHVEGNSGTYSRGNAHNDYHFCTQCGCLAYYKARKPSAEGAFRTAVNLRMTENPDQIQNLRIDHFEGLESFEDLPSDGKVIRDLWF